LAGDVFQLGNTSYRIRRIEAGKLRVEDAQGQPPGIPFWLGEAPGRSDELSQAVSRLRAAIAADGDTAAGRERQLARLCASGVGAAAATQLVDYLASARAALGTLPTQDTIVLERFFDESGGMQLVVHSPFGSRINRAWGLALRKRFCVKFNFELQAAATEDAIVISLSTSHSFPLADVARYLHSNTVRGILVQAMLAAPMFAARWRWVAGISLALPRFRGGHKVAAPLQRMRAEDLIAAVFPDQIACAENIVGEREIPDHPLVRQTIDDCLHQAMDIEGLERVLRAMEAGAIRVVARDLAAPSPLAMEILNARPYAFLDDAPLEERRTQAVLNRRWLDDGTANAYGSLDAAAIERVRSEAWPEAVDADEMHAALLSLGFVRDDEAARYPGWPALLGALAQARRATRLVRTGAARPEAAVPGSDEAAGIWVAAERLPQFDAIDPDARRSPAIDAPEEFARRGWTREEAIREIVRSRLECLGPVTAQAIAASMAIAPAEVESALAALVAEGMAMRGAYTPGAAADEACDRALLARIHRYTIKRLRQEIEPVAGRDLMRFLFRWQHVHPGADRQGPDALDAVIAQLQGFEAPAASWEAEILPARLEGYDFTWLDDLCLSGRVVWARLAPGASGAQAGARPGAQSGAQSGGSGPIRTTPVALLPRRVAPIWTRVAPAPANAATPSPRAQVVVDHLRLHGASFYDEIVDGTRLLRTQVEEALAELVARGVVTSDSFAGLRALLTPSQRRKSLGGVRRHRRGALFGIEDAGRWSLTRKAPQADGATPGNGAAGGGGAQRGTQGAPLRDAEALEHVARTLLRRYGVVAWRLLEREAGWIPPWRDLLRVLRRLEAQGEVRGGRFVADMSGEQFALPEAVAMLRDTRRSPPSATLVCVSGADPLNLVGIAVPGNRVPALAGNRVLYRDGIPLAALVAGEMRWLEAIDPAADPAQARMVEDALHRRGVGSTLPAFLR
ncbi:MAG: ATP-dependent DNA helicase, partial [Candidatus Levyibacteriota bacterium]